MGWLIDCVKKARGYSYPLVLVILATTSIASGITARVTVTYIQREKEDELLFRGQQYIRSIESYYKAGSSGQFPRGLEELLDDPRFINKKHLRRIYPDPFSSEEGESAGWRLLKNQQGRVIGVVSRSNATPIRKARFNSSLKHFENSTTYQDWQFIYTPEVRIKQNIR